MENSTDQTPQQTSNNIDVLTEELVPGFARFQLHELEEDGFVDFALNVIWAVEQSNKNPEYVLCEHAAWASYDNCFDYDPDHAKKFCVSAAGSFIIHYMENEDYVRKNGFIDGMDLPTWSWDLFDGIEAIARGELQLAFGAWDLSFSREHGDLGGYPFSEALEEAFIGEDCEVFSYTKDFDQWKKDMLAVDRVVRDIEGDVFEEQRNIYYGY